MNAIGTVLKSALLPGTLKYKQSGCCLRVDLSLSNAAKGLRIASATICTAIVHLWLQGQPGNLLARTWYTEDMRFSLCHNMSLFRDLVATSCFNSVSVTSSASVASCNMAKSSPVDQSDRANPVQSRPLVSASGQGL
jgi:hypothetical protein